MDANDFMLALEARAATAEIEAMRLRLDYNRLVDDLRYATDEILRLGGRLPYGWQVPEKMQ
jgi:hypothetical protein